MFLSSRRSFMLAKRWCVPTPPWKPKTKKSYSGPHLVLRTLHYTAPNSEISPGSRFHPLVLIYSLTFRMVQVQWARTTKFFSGGGWQKSLYDCTSAHPSLTARRSTKKNQSLLSDVQEMNLPFSLLSSTRFRSLSSLFTTLFSPSSSSSMYAPTCGQERARGRQSTRTHTRREKERERGQRENESASSNPIWLIHFSEEFFPIALGKIGEAFGRVGGGGREGGRNDPTRN